VKDLRNEGLKILLDRDRNVHTLLLFKLTVSKMMFFLIKWGVANKATQNCHIWMVKAIYFKSRVRVRRAEDPKKKKMWIP
jgi:hypothetical protein